MKKILVIGQTPPPYHGQGLMIQRLVQSKMPDIEIFHIRMCFSKSHKSIGRINFYKLFHLISIVWQMIRIKLKHRINILYYPPAGQNAAPIIRDLVILLFAKILFKIRIYHFRAAGISEFLEKSNILFKSICKWVYKNPTISIQLSDLNPADGEYFHSGQVVVVKNGIEDSALPYIPIQRKTKKRPNILCIGSVQKSKGILVLLEAAKILKEKHIDFEITVVGEFSSEEFERETRKFCAEASLEKFIDFVGVKLDSEKWDYFLRADILCFPTYFECESFGNVLLEAMMFQLPIVSTKWRAIPSIVEDERNGFLVPIKDPSALASKLECLITDKELRENMGKTGREMYLREYGLEQHLKAMEHIFHSI